MDSRQIKTFLFHFEQFQMTAIQNLNNITAMQEISGLGHSRLGVKNLESIKFKFHQPHEIAALWSWKIILADPKFLQRDGC